MEPLLYGPLLVVCVVIWVCALSPPPLPPAPPQLGDLHKEDLEWLLWVLELMDIDPTRDRLGCAALARKAQL